MKRFYYRAIRLVRSFVNRASRVFRARNFAYTYGGYGQSQVSPVGRIVLPPIY